MGFFKDLINQFKNKKAASVIDSLDLYHQCFGSGYPFLLLGEKTEVVFDEKLVKLIPGECFFRLEYQYVPTNGAPRIITIDLPFEGQTVFFSKKIIFEEQGVLQEDIQELNGLKLKKDSAFQAFNLAFILSTDVSPILPTPLKGFICPDDEKVKEVVDPIIENFKEDLEQLFFTFFAKIGKDQSQETLNQNWQKRGKQLIIEKVADTLQNTFGYNFENNVEKWLTKHYHLIP